MQAREHAEKLARLACQRENVQFLDSTVSLKKFSIARLPDKNLHLLRYFSFEFSATGAERCSGLIALYHLRQEYLFMDLPEQPTINIDSFNSEQNIE